MADYWDNIEILQTIDAWQRETYQGGPVQVNGLYLMQRLTGTFPTDRMRGFVQELHICADAGLLQFEVKHDPYRPNLANNDPTCICRHSATSRSPSRARTGLAAG